ncbi:MAG TPA: hypothetical protein V6D12_04085 [Candidatus Obscuribacterales bacterium]
MTQIITIGFGHGSCSGGAGAFIKVYFKFMPQPPWRLLYVDEVNKSTVLRQNLLLLHGSCASHSDLTAKAVSINL